VPIAVTACYYSGPTTPTCSDVNGFYPGYLIGFLGPYDVSSILVDMNSTSHYEGSFVYSMWSQVDEVIGYGTIVYGSPPAASTVRMAMSFSRAFLTATSVRRTSPATTSGG
jgi:hypothetical protein